jgi:HK97 family phage prohead protease
MKQWQAGDKINCDLSFSAHSVADAPDGFISGTASTPSTDLYGHKVLAHAFDKSIKKKGLKGPRGVKLLAGHDWNRPAGVIKSLGTIGDDLKIEAQLNLNVSYVKDLYEVAKQNDGLSFSVGFMLEEFSFVEGDASEDGEFLIIKQGDLMEVSVVTFPACVEAEMDFIKHVDTTSEFEKALVASGICRGRNEAHLIAQFAKQNTHLFDAKPPLLVSEASQSAHPLLDANQLRPAFDQIAKVKAMLSAR